MSGKLIIIRHAESEWNAKGVWTGLTDVDLTSKGQRESILLGNEIRGIKIDQAYVSEQARVHETLETILKTINQPNVPYRIAPAINERDYGEYTGKNKWQVKAAIGEDAFQSVRRGWDTPVPGGETLKDVYNRAVPFYLKTVVPLLQSGKTVLLVAHGNSTRALVKYIENLSDKEVEQLEMIFGTVLIYTVDKEGHMIKKTTKKIDSPAPNA